MPAEPTPKNPPSSLLHPHTYSTPPSSVLVSKTNSPPIAHFHANQGWKVKRLFAGQALERYVTLSCILASDEEGTVIIDEDMFSGLVKADKMRLVLGESVGDVDVEFAGCLRDDRGVDWGTVGGQVGEGVVVGGLAGLREWVGGWVGVKIDVEFDLELQNLGNGGRPVLGCGRWGP
ncbi:hypothetical protein P154DRAFT_583301 [Amniculicola lignicola CBS 123094]|uniref:Uncharacterized protein n=1 Tax=Amniculicola lignicola CBS 123094 TaxID=1392246 RepID=A0A6A5VT09_9PLEO|nr:hypothetical protein P154DRAFT_583301 [Amniculicola lignicola CBS 123094]